MRISVTHRRWVPLAWLAVAALLAALPAPAGAQVNPLWDHYKVYFVNPPIPYPVPGPSVTLVDQFTQWTHQVEQLELFANPVQKTHLPSGPRYYINEPTLHYAWWKISPQPFNAVVAATNQFGDFTLNVFDARFLLNPALKNDSRGRPPLRNHYKCYDCQGPTLNFHSGVDMADQFGSWVAVEMVPRFFCNPVEKRVGDPGAGGPVYAILDPTQHYICYEYRGEDPRIFTASITDQFVTSPTVELGPSRLLCVPTDKTGVTSTGSSTWGRMKVIYR